jgi:hypothetical protein
MAARVVARGNEPRDLTVRVTGLLAMLTQR